MIRYKGTIKQKHPNYDILCNKIEVDGFVMYDRFNVGATNKPCSMSITIDKAMKVLEDHNNGTSVISYPCTGHCLDIFPVRK